MTDLQRLEGQIERWGSLPNGQKESRDIMLMRAFMQLSACCADQKRVLDGEQPIRPLHSYPNPLHYFKE